MTPRLRPWLVVALLGIASLPLFVMLLSLAVDTITVAAPGSLLPERLSFEAWSFLWQTPPGKASIWRVTLNTLLLSGVTAALVVSVSSAAGYALARLNVPFRRFLLGGVLVMHAFPSVTLIIAIFLILQMIGLYNTLAGVILVKTALDLPLGIWIMKGFYDTVPWEIEIAGVQDGASRFTVWRKLVLPQVKPGILALGLFSVISGWNEFILPLVLAPKSDVQTLSVYLAGMIADDSRFDFHVFKAIGLFYVLPVVLLYVLFQNRLMSIYGGGTKG